MSFDNPLFASWFLELLGCEPGEQNGFSVWIRGKEFVFRDGILRLKALTSVEQQQTEGTFGFKWSQRETFESDAMRALAREWMNQKYGIIEDYLKGSSPVVLDAGCGASLSALELFAPFYDRIRYLGIDVSQAVDVAKDRCRKAGLDAEFLQCDLNQIPLAEGSVDLIFSEGVLHHTDSTEQAIKNLVPLLKQGGAFLFYVYRKKGPLREFTDDYIREQLQGMKPEQAWKAMEPLTRLGIALGELNAEIEIPEPIDLLQIPAGRINVQRLFYWHVAKMFYRADLTLDEMNHINFDWYAPANAWRQTPEEVERWCREAGLEVRRCHVEEAGITIVAQRK